MARLVSRLPPNRLAIGGLIAGLALGLAIGSDIVVLGQVIDADRENTLILYPCSVSTN